MPASSRPTRPRAAWATARTRPAVSSTPRPEVMTSSISWASSKMTASCSGSTAPPLATWVAYRWVFTTTMSAAAARARACSVKQLDPGRTPVRAWALAWTDRHSRPCPRIGLEVQFGSVPGGRTLAPLGEELHLLTEARPGPVYGSRRSSLFAFSAAAPVTSLDADRSTPEGS